MNSKTYNLIIPLFFLLFLSCEKELEISPITEKSANSFYSNEQEIESAVIGAYAQLQNNGLYGLDLIGAGEIPAEDSFEEIAANDGGRFGQLDDLSTNPGNDLVGDVWRESYVGIQRANIVLNRIENISYENSSLKNYRIGEMHFIRALLYFNLVRLYGDVPLVIEETKDPFDYFGQGRIEASKIYEQIESDLTKAIQDLPSVKTIGRPARGAANALMAQVKMTKGDHSGALTNLEAVINSGNYSLIPSTAQIFGESNEGNAEVLFEVQFSSGFNADGKKEGSSAGSQFRPSGTTANAKGHNLPSQSLIDLFETGDTRLNDFAGKSPKNPFYFSLKYGVSSTGANDGGSDHIILRLADVILNYAEALNETGKKNEAITQLNKIRSRAGLPDTTASSQEEVREAIRKERRFELFGEGKRWFDLKRYGNAVETMNTYFSNTGKNITVDEHHLLLPVPQSQVDADPDYIKQNPGY